MEPIDMSHDTGEQNSFFITEGGNPNYATNLQRLNKSLTSNRMEKDYRSTSVNVSNNFKQKLAKTKRLANTHVYHNQSEYGIKSLVRKPLGRKRKLEKISSIASSNATIKIQENRDY
mmetsp:Transcript_27267/g.24151  ORF Transcript_27267/g.24151 Transcript_27267/m.24151 type:complete len:117 (+) Transcript_27267:400-750(+)